MAKHPSICRSLLGPHNSISTSNFNIAIPTTSLPRESTLFTGTSELSKGIEQSCKQHYDIFEMHIQKPRNTPSAKATIAEPTKRTRPPQAPRQSARSAPWLSPTPECRRKVPRAHTRPLRLCSTPSAPPRPTAPPRPVCCQL